MEEVPKATKSFFSIFKRNKQADDAEAENSTEQEIMTMVTEGHEKGDLLDSEAMMIHNIFEFGDKEAKDIMTHRKKIEAIDASCTLGEALQFVCHKAFSRYPVYLDDMDNIIGVIHIKDLLPFIANGCSLDTSIRDCENLIRSIPFIPETRNIDNLFRFMQKQKSHLVIVVDEYGQTAGLVAMEDILEEIVGNILDEHDKEDSLILPQKDGSFLMDGEAEIEDVLNALGVKSEDLSEEFDTLNGYLVSLIDKIPSDGELLEVDAIGYHFEILLVENKLIQTVRIKKKE